jgi:phosphopantetheine adenylyltransferase
MEAKGILTIWNKAKEVSQKVYILVQAQDEKIAMYEAKVRKVEVLIIANASTDTGYVKALTLLVNDEVFQEGDSVLASLVQQVSNLEAR